MPARPGAGRKPGVPNKATGEVKALARGYGPEVIEGFYRLFKEADSDAAKIAAGRELLDRGYGKSVQKLAGDDEEAPIRFSAIERVIVDPKAIGSDS